MIDKMAIHIIKDLREVRVNIFMNTFSNLFSSYRKKIIFNKKGRLSNFNCYNLPSNTLKQIQQLNEK